MPTSDLRTPGLLSTPAAWIYTVALLVGTAATLNQVIGYDNAC